MNNYRYIAFASLIAAAGVASAQDTYDANNINDDDLNGTARYVSMGGAMGALGGDISVMGTNPAGIGLYRRSDAAFTLGLLTTKEDGAMGHDATRMSVDQGGAVFTFDMENPSFNHGLQYVNFGINYQKRHNFLGNAMFNISNLNGKLSQTFQIADMANRCNDYDSWGTMADMSAPIYNDDGSMKRGGIIEEDRKGYYGIGAKSAYYERATYGGISQVDANLSFNVGNRIYYGLSLGIYDVNYNRESFYSETGTDDNFYDFTNWYTTTGEGFDIKFGLICRPIADSPFRFGVSVHTPTWYGLTDANGSTLYLNDEYLDEKINGDFNYQYRTPWKFGLSLGHTISDKIALGAEYEYQDQSTSHYDIAEGEYGFENSSYFRQVNSITEETLKGQHTLKLGMEYRPVSNVAFRLGYNLVTSPFKDGAYRTIPYDGAYTETDYTNWKNTNRFTLGVGFGFRGGYFDVAYQYQSKKGDFYAFDNYDEKDSQYTLKPTSLNIERSQLMCTLGFRF